jgi:predicted PurR-regulated permease PerM
MKLNMGTTDRIIRLSIVAIIAILYFAGQLSGTVAIVLGIVAAAFLVTSLVGWCPSYVPFGISTRKGR